MWVQAGFEPDTFWHQTPLHFQAIMRGVRKRLEQEAEAALTLAWSTAAMTGATQSKGGLKPLKHYLRRPAKVQTPKEMLAAIKAIQAAGASMTIKQIER